MATTQFDQVVRSIEGCACNEAAHGTIVQHWAPCGDEDTCSACDFRHFCPNPAPRLGAVPHPLTAPHPP